MTHKKNLCAKCGVCHGAPTGKKCVRQGEGDKLLMESQGGGGGISNSLQASPLVMPKADDADHLARTADDRIVKVEQTVTEMRTMMAEVLKAIGVKENQEELTDSPVEMSSDDSFVEVRSRKKKQSKRSHRSHRRSHARSTSSSSESKKVTQRSLPKNGSC